MTENVTIFIDWVQRFNFSKANGSISFITPESAANQSYAQILVSDAMGIGSVNPDRVYYSDKVRASKAHFAALPATRALSRFGRHEFCIRLVGLQCENVGDYGAGLDCEPCPEVFVRRFSTKTLTLKRCSAAFSRAPPPAGCDLSRRLPLLAQARVLEQRRCTHSCHGVVELGGACME